MKQKTGIGCFGVFALLILIGLAIQYWYLIIAGIVLSGAIGVIIIKSKSPQRKHKPRHDANKQRSNSKRLLPHQKSTRSTSTNTC